MIDFKYQIALYILSVIVSFLMGRYSYRLKTNYNPDWNIILFVFFISLVPLVNILFTALLALNEFTNKTKPPKWL